MITDPATGPIPSPPQPSRETPGLVVEDSHAVLWEPLPGTEPTSVLWAQRAVRLNEHRENGESGAGADFTYSTVQDWDTLAQERWPLQVLVPYQDAVPTLTPAPGAASYRKMPVVIQAMHLDATNADAVAAWCGGRATIDGLVVIATLEGDMTASVGDYVIQGVQGEFYPCKPDVFAATYESA